MNFLHRWKFTVLAFIALIAIAAFRMLPAETVKAPFPTVTMKAGSGWFSAEMVVTEDDMKTGLMFRQSLDEHAGMLFTFPKIAKHCVWMVNTLIPLSVAWLDKDGVILGIQNMTPNTTDLHCSPKPASYALEVKQGAFERQDIKVGMQFL